MSSQSLGAGYKDWAKTGAHLYPTEFVIRTFLGHYPRHQFHQDWHGTRVLDLGFGDGRNFPLLANMGATIYGVELTEEIVELARARFPVAADNLRVGNNSSIPFDEDFFDCVLACHSCYYLASNQTFADNIREISRVLKPGGHFVFSVPDHNNFLFTNPETEQTGKSQFMIRNEPYGMRRDQAMAGFTSSEDLEMTLFPTFRNIRLGHQDDDYYGIRVSYFFGVAQK